MVAITSLSMERPRCDPQREILRVRIPEVSVELFARDQCDTTWITKVVTGKEVHSDFRNCMDTFGIKSAWPKIDILDEPEKENGQ